jgi:hypothetical protein
MKVLTSILMTAVLASTAIAGPIASKNPKAPVMPPPAPTGCECFAPGFTLGVFGGAFIPDSGDAALGGGLLGEYFFSEYVGVQGSYGVFATNSEHHAFDANLVLRVPIKSACIAPYALVGGGYGVNSVNEGNFHVGGGIDIRLPSMGCKGIFADGVYYFPADSEEFTIVRLGVKIPF